MFFKGLIFSLIAAICAPVMADLGEKNTGFGVGLDSSLITWYNNRYQFLGGDGIDHMLSPYLEYKSERDIYSLYFLIGNTNYFAKRYHDVNIDEANGAEADKFMLQMTLQYAFLDYLDYNSAIQYAAYFSYRWRGAGQQREEDTRSYGNSMGVRVGYAYFFKPHLNMTLWFTPVSYNIDKYPANLGAVHRRYTEMRYANHLSIAFSYIF